MPSSLHEGKEHRQGRRLQFVLNGAMNQSKSSRAIPATLPVLYIAPRNDYPGLIRFKSSMFAALPANPLTRIADIDSDHLNAPRNSIEEIIRWTTEVAAR